MFYLKFGNVLLISGTGFIPDITREQAKQDFKIGIDVPFGDKLYTLVIFDNDAPYPGRNTASPYVHLFVYNIRNGDVVNGDYLLDYVPPNPPVDSPPHVYQVQLWSQPSKLNYIKGNGRSNFPLNEMLKQSSFVDRFDFTVGDFGTIPLSTEAPVAPTPSSFSGSLFGSPRYVPPPASPSIVGNRHDFFRSDSTLTEQQKKYCSCQLKVTDKGTAYNPYAVCAKSVGTTTRDCTNNYDFNKMPDNLLRAYLRLHKLPVIEPYNRNDALATINAKLHSH